MKRYFLRVTNPQKGTYHFLMNLCNEFHLKFEEHWQRADDPDLKLYTKPVYARHFKHVVQLYSKNKEHVEFGKYLVADFINKVEKMEEIYHLEIKKVDNEK